MKQKNPEKALAITKIVFGVVQWVLNLFKGKHGDLPATVGEMKEEADRAREATPYEA